MAKDILEQIKEGINSLVGTTNKALETGRIQLDIQQMKVKIASLQKSVGKKVFEQYQREHPSVDFEDEELAVQLKEIQFYVDKIKELEERLKTESQA